MPFPSTDYIAFQGLQTYFSDRDTATALSGGYVEFYSSTDKETTKDVFMQTRNPDNTFTFTNIGWVVDLNTAGAFSSPTDGTDIQVYAYPFDSNGDFELYYLKVYDADGIFQFDRDAQPANAQAAIVPETTFVEGQNLIENPQFAFLSLTSPASITIMGTDVETEIAPGWTLIASAAVSGTITVTQTAVVDSTILTNPPYVLNINTTGITSSTVTLRQRFNASPRLLLNSYIAGSILVSVPSGLATPFTMKYVPSSGAATTYYFFENKNTKPNSNYQTLEGTTATFDTPQSTASAPAGYVDIDIVFPANLQINISSIQIVEVASDMDSAQFQQEPQARQTDYLFNYYQPALNYKPIKSFMVGWDFPLNPAQFTNAGAGSTGAIGANKSIYAWDQTILFSATDSGLTYARDTNTGGFQVTAAAATRFAVIQYLPIQYVPDFLNSDLSIQLKGFISTGTLVGTMSLWYSNDASLPNLTAGNNNSAVVSIAADGVPTVGDAGTHGTWVEIENGNYTKSFTLTTTNTAYDFLGYTSTVANPYASAKWIAVVVAFDTLALASAVTFDYISVVPGTIPTRPSIQAPDEVTRECQFYWAQSFLLGVPAATNIGVNTGESDGIQAAGAGSSSYGVFLNFDTYMRTTPTVTLYNPANTNAELRNIATNADWSGTDAYNRTTRGFSVRGTTPDGSNSGQGCAIHWTADARLGIV